MISFVIPIKNEAASLLILYHELTGVLAKLKTPYEIIFINDGSTDRTKEILTSLTKRNKKTRVFHFRANFGKSAALAFGFGQAQGSTIVTMDADLQDNPVDIPAMLQKLRLGYDLVVGWRKTRHDDWKKLVSTYLFNTGTRLLSAVPLHDYNCGLKVIRTDIAKRLDLHGELHRFIPVLVAKLKYRVTELPVHHRRRRYGISKFGLERGWRGMIDLLTVLFLTQYEGKPAHFFSLIGFFLFCIGFLFDGYVTYLKITTGTIQRHTPLLLAGILFIVVGLQLISTGLIAELIITNSHKPHDYE